eukprot:CAMPEP_0194771680 /NCGR_PEP_ID=MMETSP0323_2-20130528/49854_1 /TAXON_ID=2866 ORGANISM="Crypthecodinium cohnii, Strain Seligo" /NCGR_SAMPLE_ID=MMETSP0323_2 /ASSEMBLY_ACC=CAM_ASM_000346 /LENGTH=46 /DNA_ID= /DNA_START= /DNA_END= /DNA_ORIENTATION=
MSGTVEAQEGMAPLFSSVLALEHEGGPAWGLSFMSECAAPARWAPA